MGAALRRLTTSATAVELYRTEHGAYPTSLAEVRADGQDVPVDIFTGDDLIYRRTESRYTLYSVGTNGVDDGGAAVGFPSKGDEAPPIRRDSADWGEGDIVWAVW
jgi:hypothetical protein